MLGQRHGWPVPVGGAGQLTAALVRRLEARGGTLRLGTPVSQVMVRDGRGRGVRPAEGEPLLAARAVLADVPAPALYGGLVGWDHLPARLREDIRRFHWDHATLKVDWALSRPIPWAAPEAAHGGTVHIADSVDHLTRHSADLTTGVLPEHPAAVLGQMTTADPTRSPAGTESAWAYVHVPRGIPPAVLRGTMADRLEASVERVAPGFRDTILDRRVLAPTDLERLDRGLVGGALNGGTAAPHQQLFFRPVPGTGRPDTPVAGLFLASSSAHPGGGVHGACGANAARAALRSQWPVVRHLRRAGAAFRTEPNPRERTRTWPSDQS